jgi:hypothetical protein
MSDEYDDDPDWEYGFRLDQHPEVWSRVFGRPITSEASARHAAVKSYWETYEMVRHPKGSQRDDDWEPLPAGVDPEPTPTCVVCGKPATYRTGRPDPKWCDQHGPHGSSSSGSETS